jgi:hypothetical protein
LHLLMIINGLDVVCRANKISTTSGMGTNHWKKYKIENFPIREATPEVEQQMERLVDYLLWQKSVRLLRSRWVTRELVFLQMLGFSEADFGKIQPL